MRCQTPNTTSGDIFRSERGSAFVLTLLFIMLLTTLSAGMYIYGTKQAIQADSNYTTVASDFIAQAGLEAGKKVLLSDDMMEVDRLGNNDGHVTEDDFPCEFPQPTPVGFMMTPTDNKSGRGAYTVRIDAQFSDQLEMEFRLIPHYAALTNLVGPVPASALWQTLSFQRCTVTLNQDGQPINTITLDSGTDLSAHMDGTHAFFPFTFENLVNPMANRTYSMAIEATRIDYDDKHSVTWGGPAEDQFLFMNLFPNADESSAHIGGALTAATCKTLNFTKKGGYYLIKLERVPSETPELKIVYDDAGGFTQVDTLIQAGDWTAGVTTLYYLFNLKDNNYGQQWIDRKGPTGVAGTFDFTTPPTQLDPTQEFAIIVDGIPPVGGLGCDLHISRGYHNSLELQYRMRTRKMWETCSGGNPAALDCCWFPEWPNSCGSPSSFTTVANLSEATTGAGTHADTDITVWMQLLDREQAIRVDELYTVTATGNVERGARSQQLYLSPISYVDYARFQTGDMLILSGNTSLTGRIYSAGRIRILPGGPVNFFDNVYTSDRLMDQIPAATVFNGDAELFTYQPMQTLPDHNLIAHYSALAGSGGFYITGDAEIFLGLYDYHDMANAVYGFDFFDTNPGDGLTEARYTVPTSSMRVEELPYRPGGYSLSGLPGMTGTITLGGMSEFNGVVFVNGDCRIWGKLHGRSLTIFARGDIYIEREIIMGTENLEPTTPNLSVDGKPVHLGLISGQAVGTTLSGDIYISEYAPRNLKIEAALMAIGGVIQVEDVDAVNPSPPPPAASFLDTDRSHKLMLFNKKPGQFIQFVDSIPTDRTVDLNWDGRLDGNVGGFNEVPTGEEYPWYLVIEGPLLTTGSNNFGFYKYRTEPLYNVPARSRSIEYNYDPSIRQNMPPMFPVPERNVEVLEWTHAVPALPE